MAGKKPKQPNGQATASVARLHSPDERQQMIAEAAYFRALERGFQNGDPVADWLQAELEIDNALLNPPERDKLPAEHDQSPAQRHLPETHRLDGRH